MADFKTRPYYYLFNGAIVIYAAGLLLRGAWPEACLSLGAVSLIHLVTRRAPKDQVGGLEGLVYPVVMTLFFFGTASTIPLLRPEVKYDQMLQAIDQRFFFDIEAWVAAVSRPWLSDILSFCYLLYGPLMYSSIIYYAFFKKELGLPYFGGLFCIFGFGFLGYLAVPAEGPHFAKMAEVMPLIASGPFHTFADPLIKDGCTRSDVFPSLHIAISWYTLIFMLVHSRRLFWLWLLPVAGLSLATVYLFYHYQIDLLAGLGLALIAFAFSRMVWRENSKQCAATAPQPGQYADATSMTSQRLGRLAD